MFIRFNAEVFVSKTLNEVWVVQQLGNALVVVLSAV
jgi:hypothetical protein